MQSAVSAVVGMFVVSRGGAGLVTERDAVLRVCVHSECVVVSDSQPL